MLQDIDRLLVRVVVSPNVVVQSLEFFFSNLGLTLSVFLQYICASQYFNSKVELPYESDTWKAGSAVIRKALTLSKMPSRAVFAITPTEVLS